MPEVNTSYHSTKQTIAKDCKTISCPPFDPIKNFKRDPTGYYILLRPNFETLNMELALCNKNHVIEMIFVGRKAQDIYDAVLMYEKKHGLKWFQEKTHIAYLGKELKKCEWALAAGQNAYFQE